MKKFFLMIATGLITTSAFAQKQVWEYDYASVTKFPWYVMGYEPAVIDGVLTSAAPFMELKRDENDQLYETGEECEWYQYFIADGIPTKEGESYTAVVNCKCSENTDIALNMGWGWGDGQNRSGKISMTTEWSDVSVVFKNIEGKSCNLVLQPGGFQGTIEIKTIKVYQNAGPAQYETEPIASINYSDYTSYPYDDLGEKPEIKDGVLSFTPVLDPENSDNDITQFYAMYNVKFEPDTFYGVIMDIKGSKEGTLSVGLGDFGDSFVDASFDISEEWTEVQVPVGVVPNVTDIEEPFVLITADGYDGTIEMKNCTLAVFTEIIPEPTTKWVSVIKNGDANEGSSPNMIDREPAEDLFDATLEPKDYEATVSDNPDGEGKVFSCPIVANPDPGVNHDLKNDTPESMEGWSGVNDWSSQFFILFDEALEEDTNLKVSFDYYCTDSRTISTQAHGKPGNYHHWEFIGNLAAKPEWQHKAWEGTVSASQAGGDGCWSIAFNLSTAEPAATFYINNVVVEVEKDIEGGEDAVKTVNAIIVPAKGVYNLQGVKVANSLDEVTVPGLYITNGKKVIKK